MSVIAEAEQLALSLSDSDGVTLAEKLIPLLPGPFIEDDDDGVEEAIRRSEELKNNPDIAMSLEELDRRMQERFGRK